VLDDVDLRILDEKVADHTAHCELRGRYCGGELDRSGRSSQPVTDDVLRLLGLLQRVDGVPVALAAGIRHPELS
jgi:hypothetical protein